MKAVLMSIQPKWCELIANGKKTVEVRKTKPKLETPFKAYIYCTANKQGTKDLLEIHGTDGKIRKANGKVIGEFVCKKIEEYYADDYAYGTYDISDDEVIKTCLVNGSLWDYGKGQNLYGWHISDLVIYDKPRELSKFKTPPCEKPESACENCKYLEVTNTPNTYEVECFREDGIYLTRPPQSWCYVESKE